jgi:hypothetical protein
MAWCLVKHRDNFPLTFTFCFFRYWPYPYLIVASELKKERRMPPESFINLHDAQFGLQYHNGLHLNYRSNYWVGFDAAVENLVERGRTWLAYQVTWLKLFAIFPVPPGKFIGSALMYEGVTKSFRTGCLVRALQMIQFSATRCSCTAILWVSLVSFAAIILCVASQRAIPKVSVYFLIGSVRKLLDTPS